MFSFLSLDKYSALCQLTIVEWFFVAWFYAISFTSSFSVASFYAAPSFAQKHATGWFFLCIFRQTVYSYHKRRRAKAPRYIPLTSKMMCQFCFTFYIFPITYPGRYRGIFDPLLLVVNKAIAPVCFFEYTPCLKQSTHHANLSVRL